ncbi:DUF2637 domain-containing protein [Streptomyces hirsutus]|uniref:DUF2637 domain-containing protein n=1 Tax=Streptomyces hirsutus TaxID=35620 RepID=UPI00386610AD|nr:DUF2637 domain-containing protein [Streptomyces hirsutus]
MDSPAPTPTAAVRGSRTVRAGIVLLAAVGFTLSYDALRQMAVAIHVRGLLTYLFPLVIDGFIAIGVIALLLLRTAPLRSRLYVWTLVGGATVTSIWASTLHAIRLNERTRLYLDNATVGALSAIAPLALAGAVHLHIVINRHLTADATAAEPPTTTQGAEPPTRTRRPTPPPTAPNRQGRQQQQAEGTATATAGATPPEAARKAAPETPESPSPALGRASRRRSTVPEAELLATARTLGAKAGRVSRPALEQEIRAKGYTIRKDLAQEAANTVTAELASANTSHSAT